MLDAICGRANECACESFEAQVSSEMSCRSQHGATFDELYAVIDAGRGYSYDGVCATRWIEMLESMECSRFDELESLAALWEEVGCKIYTLDSVGEYCSPSRLGDSCSSNKHCMDTLDIDVFVSACVPIDRRRKGESCDPEIVSALDGCAPGLYCESGECAPWPEAGEACSWRLPCGEDWVCDAATDTCVEGAPPGEACGEGLTSCAQDHYCDIEGTCHALPSEGEICHLDEQGPACASGFDCGADLSCWPDRPSYCIQLVPE